MLCSIWKVSWLVDGLNPYPGTAQNVPFMRQYSGFSGPGHEGTGSEEKLFKKIPCRNGQHGVMIPGGGATHFRHSTSAETGESCPALISAFIAAVSTSATNSHGAGDCPRTRGYGRRSSVYAGSRCVEMTRFPWTGCSRVKGLPKHSRRDDRASSPA